MFTKEGGMEDMDSMDNMHVMDSIISMDNMISMDVECVMIKVEIKNRTYFFKFYMQLF